MVTWRRGSASALMLLTVVLGGCGGDKSASPAPTRLPSPESDKLKAQQANLTLADVPGFTEEQRDTDNDEQSFDDAVNACVGNDPVLIRLGEEGDARGARSPTFSKAGVQGITSTVTFSETADEPRAAIAALNAPSFPQCFTGAITDQLRKSATFTDVTGSTAKLPALIAGDESTGYRSTLGATAAGRPVTMYADFTFVRVGRGFAVVSGFSLSTPFSEAERVRLVDLIARRLA